MGNSDSLVSLRETVKLGTLRMPCQGLTQFAMRRAPRVEAPTAAQEAKG